MYRFWLILMLLLYGWPVHAHSPERVRVAVLPFETPEGDVTMRQYGVGTMDLLAVPGAQGIGELVQQLKAQP